MQKMITQHQMNLVWSLPQAFAFIPSYESPGDRCLPRGFPRGVWNFIVRYLFSGGSIFLATVDMQICSVNAGFGVSLLWERGEDGRTELGALLLKVGSLSRSAELQGSRRDSRFCRACAGPRR